MKRTRQQQSEGSPAGGGAERAKLLRGAPRALATLATCNLNQWALDFDGNMARIIESIRIAKARGARYRLGPELEVPGYGCEDHFLEQDTLLHSWQSLAHILRSGVTDGILCDIGLPVLHRGVRYNARALCLDGRLLLVRPKLHLADDGNYREGRWFTPWCPSRPVEQLELPTVVADALGGVRTVPIGFAALSLRDTALGAETCEELFTPNAPHIALALDGVEIFANGSGSHHELRKLDKRLRLLTSASEKGAGVYVYANQQGCDGGRLYYDGCALVVVNGEVVAQGTQFSLRDVEVVTATVDLETVRSARAAIASRSIQAARATPVHRVSAPFALCAAEGEEGGCAGAPSAPFTPRIHPPEEEIAYGPACWLWDYLRRSGGGGFFLALSGGADSSSTAAIVGCMCQLLHAAVTTGAPPGGSRAAAGAGAQPEPDAGVLAELRRVTRQPAGWVPASSAEIANLVLTTCYMGTDNSSAETRERAAALAREVGAHHIASVIDPMVRATLGVFHAFCGRSPRYGAAGGTPAEDLALQNVQARLRMVYGYLLAQLVPWTRGREGFLLVLGSANVDEVRAPRNAPRALAPRAHASRARARPATQQHRSDGARAPRRRTRAASGAAAAGTAWLHDQVRLLGGGPQPDRGHLEDRPQALPSLGRRRPRLSKPARRGRGGADRRASAAGRYRRDHSERRGGHGDDVRRALEVRLAAQAGALWPGEHVRDAPRRVGARPRAERCGRQGGRAARPARARPGRRARARAKNRGRL